MTCGRRAGGQARRFAFKDSGLSYSPLPHPFAGITSPGASPKHREALSPDAASPSTRRPRTPATRSEASPGAAATVTTETLDEPIRRRDDLLVPFTEACKPRGEWRIGPEMEKCGLFEATRRARALRSASGASLRVLEELVGASTAGRRSASTKEAPSSRSCASGASVTLEPGGQLELSGAMAENIHQVVRRAARRTCARSRPSRRRWASAGWASASIRSRAARTITWVPKQRYGVMREYLPTRGGHALDMMLRTCTVQVNLDYESEADAMRKMRVALALAPATTAMFANSPWKEGRAARRPHVPRPRVARRRPRSHRASVPALWKRGRALRRLRRVGARRPDVPLQARRPRRSRTPGRPFRCFWKSGFEGHTPTMDDWKTHLNTLFPEVRLKKTIEIRGRRRAVDGHGVRAPRAVDRHPLRRPGARRGRGARRGLDVRRGRRPSHARLAATGCARRSAAAPLAEVAERMVAIADGGLERRAHRRRRVARTSGCTWRACASWSARDDARRRAPRGPRPRGRPRRRDDRPRHPHLESPTESGAARDAKREEGRSRSHSSAALSASWRLSL